MIRDNAVIIANKHLKEMNPTMWSGKGKRPKKFDIRIATYPLTDEFELDVSFEFEEGKWAHYCELRSPDTELCECSHGYGIDSVESLTNTILSVCVGYELV
jgi:hypothetical protein